MGLVAGHDGYGFCGNADYLFDAVGWRFVLVADMNIVVVSQKKSTVKPLTRAQIEQLKSYCLLAERSGTYYGNQSQFIARHNAIVDWLNDCSEKLK